jgi:hypothetical protein
VFVAFFFTFLILIYQGTLRIRNCEDETFFKTVEGALVGSLLASMFSWLLVCMLIVMMLGKKVYGLNGEE